MTHQTVPRSRYQRHRPAAAPTSTTDSIAEVSIVVLDVVPQYSLLQWNQWSTWEQLLADDAGNDFAGLFDGSWSGMNEFLRNHFHGSHGSNRFVQVVINPFPF